MQKARFANASTQLFGALLAPVAVKDDFERGVDL
jgi:hypothetical protein